MLNAPRLLVNVERAQSNSNTDHATRLSISMSRHRFHDCSRMGASIFFKAWKSILLASLRSASEDKTPDSLKPVTKSPLDASASS
jgi:hypothetical protein